MVFLLQPSMCLLVTPFCFSNAGSGLNKTSGLSMFIWQKCELIWSLIEEICFFLRMNFLMAGCTLTVMGSGSFRCGLLPPYKIVSSDLK